MSNVADSWGVLLDSIRTAITVVDQWRDSGKISVDQREELQTQLQTLLETYTADSQSGQPTPSSHGYLPMQPRETPGIRGYRAGMFVVQFVNDLRSRMKLSLAQFHVLENDSNERLMAVSRALRREGISERELSRQCSVKTTSQPSLPMSGAFGSRSVPTSNDSGEIVSGLDTPVPPAEPAKPRRNIIEILLDPRSIQLLLGLGGALMVVGLVILLWLNDFFTPTTTAIGMALGSVAMLAAGLALILKTRYQMAGKAVAFLACAVLPLNLWYLHANNLVTIDGHLWVAGIFICGLYAVAGWILKDHLFVYVFTGGITLTGLLILADLNPSPQRFWEIASPSTLLVILGLIGIHLERAFTVNDGPFNRQKFGLAFFWAGHIQMAAGLLLLFGAQLSGDWLYPFWFKPVFDSYQAVPSPVCGSLRWLAIVLVLAGTYAYVYSDVVVRRRGIFVNIAGAMLLWAEVLIVQYLDLKLGVDAIIAILAVTSLAIHLIQLFAPRDTVFVRSFPAFGVVLGVVPVLIGLTVYLDNLGIRAVWTSEAPRWSFVIAMLLAGAACRLGAFVATRSGASQSLVTTHFFATGAATMIAAVAALAAMGMNEWKSHAPIMMLIPIAWLVASYLYKEREPAEPLYLVAQFGAAIMLLSSLASSFMGFFALSGAETVHLPLALFFAEAAVFYGLVIRFGRPSPTVMPALMACASLWQLLAWCGLGAQAFLLVFGIIGLAMLFVYRLSLLEQTAYARLSEALYLSANGVLSLSFVGSILYGLSQLFRSSMTQNDTVDWGFAGFCIAMLGINLTAVLATNQASVRRWFVVTCVGLGGVTLLALHNLINLTPWQQVELFSVLVGLCLLVVGHLGWYREQDRESEFVSMSLLFGSLLASVPLAIATWIDRGDGVFNPVNEFGFLFVSIGLLASGVICQLKASTLIGTLSTALYFLTLLIFVPWGQLNSVALAILIGGSVLFGTGMILAFFRDRLLTLPDRIKNREGIFKVFNWR